MGPLRIHSRPRYWNLLENVFEQDLKSLKSDQYCCKTKSVEKAEEKSSTSTVEENKMELQSDNSEAKKALEPVTKTISKQFMSSVRCHEVMERVDIKIQFHGHKFKAENLDVQVINNNILVVKAEDDEEKFERKFELTSNVLFDEIESKLDN